MFILCLLFVVQFLGCIVIGYIAWVLATSTTVNRFLSGTLVHTICRIFMDIVKSFLMFCLYYLFYFLIFACV